jgi:hypothetical protein
VQAPPAAPPPVRLLPPPPRPAAPADWHDLPATSGVWQWSREGGLSIARFGAPRQPVLLSLTCNPQTHTITVARAGAFGPATEMSIMATSLSRRVAIHQGAEGPMTATIDATLPARDPLLDAMAFSRGRFAVEVRGLAPLYLPSWPEVSRIVEDCR